MVNEKLSSAGLSPSARQLVFGKARVMRQPRETKRQNASPSETGRNASLSLQLTRASSSAGVIADDRCADEKADRSQNH